jgi:2-dehydro-3-deoxyphosphogluconate aldolase/(4S)-4-hydroxy-2-oxoglutarate aldolase
MAAAGALVDGGVRVLEVTFTVPRAEEIIRELRQAHPHAIVGAGTVRTAADVGAARRAGAQFLVSPGAGADLLVEMASSGIFSVPGVFTPSEIMCALDHGVEAVKLFPASALGPGILGGLRGPFPGLEVVPSGGISTTAVGSWLEAGAIAVGLGSLATPADIASENWRGIREKALAMTSALEALDAGFAPGSAEPAAAR